MKRFRIFAAAALFTLTLPLPAQQDAERKYSPVKPPSAGGLSIVPRPRPSAFQVNVWADRQTYDLGDSVRVQFRATQDAEVYIHATDARGRTRQIFPNWYDRDNSVQAGVSYAIPDASYDLVAEPPAGSETISIIAVQGRYRTMDRYETFSQSDPFPSGAAAKAEIQRVVPRERRHELVAEDSTVIHVRGEVRGKGHDDDTRRYLW